MTEMKVNNIFKIKDKEVDYYEWAGKKFQFDEIFEIKVDIDPNDRSYSKLIMDYPDGRQPKIMTIRSIYEAVMTGILTKTQSERQQVYLYLKHCYS